MAAWGRTDEMSDGGIHGYDATPGDIPQGTRLEGNIIRESGIWEKQSSCFFPGEDSWLDAPGAIFLLKRLIFLDLNNICYHMYLWYIVCILYNTFVVYYIFILLYAFIVYCMYTI